MKTSKRNLANARAKAEKLAAGPPRVSKYLAKRQAQLVEANSSPD